VQKQSGWYLAGQQDLARGIHAVGDGIDLGDGFQNRGQVRAPQTR
jgi:hypothetical protein